MFDALFRRPERKSAELYKELSTVLMGGYQTRSGQPVSWKTALECSTVLACTRVIAEGLSQIPWKLYQKNGDRKEPATGHPLYDLLHRRPNEWQTSFEFREQIALHLVLARNAYVFVSRSTRGEVLELLPMSPADVNVKTPKRLGELPEYSVRMGDGRPEIIPPANIWHLRGLSWDGIQGLDGVRLAREAIGLANAAEQQSAGLFSNGTRPSGTLTIDTILRPEQVEEFRKQWAEHYAGAANAGKTPILSGGWKWNQVSMDADKAQMIETRRMQVEQICSAFRVLPIMIGYSDKTATYASAEQMFLAHVVHTLGPWIERIEQSADVNLLTEAERKNGYYTHFTTAGLLRGAHQDRANYYAKALGSGGSPAWMTPDEVRGLEELNPMGGTAGDLPTPTNTGTQASPTP
jgi:HK97 family phage portal protein